MGPVGLCEDQYEVDINFDFGQLLNIMNLNNSQKYSLMLTDMSKKFLMTRDFTNDLCQQVFFVKIMFSFILDQSC